MKSIAISCEGPGLDAPVDPRFGRAAGFLLVDPDTLEFEYLDNGQAQTLPQGAGINAAQALSGKGVTTLLTGIVGPKAEKALTGAGIRIVQNMDNGSVREALARLNQGAPSPQPTQGKGYSNEIGGGQRQGRHGQNLRGRGACGGMGRAGRGRRP